jgi:hypothetical protein
MKTLYAVTVDTEEEWDWDSGWPTTPPSVLNIRRLPRFQELCTCLGAATTYFTNLAVLEDPEARGILLDLAGRSGVEVGMHIHPWNTPPVVGEGPVRAHDTFLHNLPRELAIAKLGRVHETFLEHGLKPTSFRGGRYSSGPVCQDFLRDREFLVDASVVPYTTWKDDGAPDFRLRSPKPVRLPPRRADDRPLWELPLTLGFTRPPARVWRWAFELVERSRLRHLRLVGIADRLGLVRRVWLNFEDPAGEKMLSYLEQLRRERPTFICFTLHSSSLMAGGSPYTRTRADENRLFGRLEEVLGTLAAWDEFQPATVTEIAGILEEYDHARARHQSPR